MGYRKTLAKLNLEGNLRVIPSGNNRAELIDLSLNDYLGLACRTDLQREFFSREENRRIAMTTSASRLLASDQEQHWLLEERLKELYDGREALIFNSGYHANTGLLSALASEKGTLIVADKLIHASMIDGITLSKAPFQRFVHNDFNRLENIIRKECDKWERIIVAVESIYSMDGDRTSLDALVDIKRKYGNILLYVDEAHAFGATGCHGLGLCHDHEAFGEFDVVIGTFGKACASMGAFAIMSKELRDYAVNRSRSFIFSTALPPINCAWTRYMIDSFITMDTERNHLKLISRHLCSGLGIKDVRYIIPVIAGSASKALEMSAKLLDQGFKVLPIRTPTVPPGTERLRISLNASLEKATIDRLLTSINEIQTTD